MKIGILGGGQLGKMLYAPASKLDLDIQYMDVMEYGPVSQIAKKYHRGDITNREDVLAFGRNSDYLTIEIEKVNISALKKLRDEGVSVSPQPEIVECIQDKGLQKQFYEDNNLPTARFKLYTSAAHLKDDIRKGIWKYPFVQKLRRDGYDGRGVKIIKSESDLGESFNAPFLVEDMIPIEIEIGVVTCQNARGEIVIYDPVEMVFHPEANILLYQLAPARINADLAEEVKKIAKAVTKAFGIVGLLAIEMFLSKEGRLIINEVAPRPHNSGHHTIEAALCSQYENHLRAICGYPLGATNTIVSSLLMNILGEEGYEGPVHYEGLDKILALPGVNVHIYGKTVTKPYRKMGHITILGHRYEHLIEQYEYIRQNLSVITK